MNRGLVEVEKLIHFLADSRAEFDDQNARPLEVSRGLVKFEDVGFSSGPGKPVVGSINFEACRCLVGVVGEIGSGKTTLLHLLVRFYDVTTGSITIDGQDIRSVTLESLRRNIGVVMQVILLFFFCNY